MKSWKKLVSLIAIWCLLWGIFLLWIMFGPVLDDQEFDDALARAESVDLYGVETIRDYPFSTITRAEATTWYVTFGQQTGLMPVRSSCNFTDIDAIDSELQEAIGLSCQYGFFGWSKGTFEPNAYMTKGMSLVALMRGVQPGREFPQVEEYRMPYMEEAHRLGITKREPWPYVNYLITRYEMLLQMWRAWQIKRP